MTFICANSSMFWNVRAIPSSATLSGRVPMIDSPSNRMSPSCGRYTWLIVLKIDVLPAPFGPMIANSSPGLHVERHVVDRGDAAEPQGDVVDFEQWCRSSATLPDVNER